MCYIDEDGQYWWWIFGAFSAFGAYMGGAAANDNWNMFQWDWGETWGNIVGGAIQGGLDFITMSYGFQAIASIEKPFTLAGTILRWTSAGINMASALTTIASLISDFDNGMDILRGNYYYDESRTIMGQILQGINRGTRERFQQAIGYNSAQIRNVVGDVNQVTFFRGATLVNLKYDGVKHSGMTMGNMINGWNINSTDEPIFMHEYGHVLQSQRYGLYYGLWHAPASLVNQILYKDIHKRMSIEIEANVLAREYFGDVFDTTKFPIY